MDRELGIPIPQPPISPYTNTTGPPLGRGPDRPLDARAPNKLGSNPHLGHRGGMSHLVFPEDNVSFPENSAFLVVPQFKQALLFGVTDEYAMW